MHITLPSKLLTESRRFPIALQCLPAVGLILGCFYLPFSPRWCTYQPSKMQLHTEKFCSNYERETRGSSNCPTTAP
jgi:hypothetical protein